MRSASQQMLRSQKLVRQPTYRIENEREPEASPQNFQILVNISEGRKFAWANPNSPNSYVVVAIGKKKYRTMIRKNMAEPSYRECFTFEMYACASEVQCSNLWLAVMEQRCYAPPRLLGEVNVDLGMVWAQPNHQLCHKWAQLRLPRDQFYGCVGFLQIDVQIILKCGTRTMVGLDVENNVQEEYLLLPTDCEQQRAKFIITVYNGFSIESSIRKRSHLCVERPPNTFVRISFCGLVAKTTIQYRMKHPNYYQKISIVEMFPNINQIINIEVYSVEISNHKLMAVTHLNLSEVSHSGENGFLPTFGPSLLNMYGTSFPDVVGIKGVDGPYYRGALLVSLRTVVPHYEQSYRTVEVEPCLCITPENLWCLEDFCIFCPILEVSMLDPCVITKFCGVAITIGEFPCEKECRAEESQEFPAAMNEIRKHKLHLTVHKLEATKTRQIYGHVEFYKSFPVLQFLTTLPDYRFRMYKNNVVLRIISELNGVIGDVEHQLQLLSYNSMEELTDMLYNGLNDAAENILNYDNTHCGHTVCCNGEIVRCPYATELDRKHTALQREEMEKIYHCIKSILDIVRHTGYCEKGIKLTKKSVKLFIAEAKSIVHELSNIICKASEGWPDIVVWLLNDGSRVAYFRVAITDIIHSSTPEQCGKDCGKIKTLYLKPLKCQKHIGANCFCIVGKVVLQLWMGLFKEKFSFENCSLGYKIKCKGLEIFYKSYPMIIEFRVFIFCAKLCTGCCGVNAFIRVNVVNTMKESKSQPCLLGRVEIAPTVDEPDCECAPKLMWYNIYKGLEFSGKILMSVQLVQVPESLLKSTVYSRCAVNLYDETSKRSTPEVCTNREECVVEPLPESIVPKSTTYKIDIYWWGLRDLNITKKPCVVLEIEDTTLKSDIISCNSANCNFPNGKATEMFEAPLSEAYGSLLTFKLYDSTSFGRTLFLGTKAVKNPNKYIINYLAKNERESVLWNAIVIPDDFIQVNKMLCVKSYKPAKNVSPQRTYATKMSYKQLKRSPIAKIFQSKVSDEEKYTLLPIVTKENEKRSYQKLHKEKNWVEMDWWDRFLFCQNGQSSSNMERSSDFNAIRIYDSELEKQPEFSKFKDWCTTLKFFRGEKTGVPENDRQLHCGFLKIGIAIYRWPPPPNTVAVNHTGVELNQGFFDEHPKNDPVKILVRLYVVKVIDLLMKESDEKPEPYVIINCGKKQLGERKNRLQKSSSQIFGNMYELRCILPEEYQLTVSLFDYDNTNTDKLLGFTTIDLEDRFYTKHRATVGISTTYKTRGPSKWRDCSKPSEILEGLCLRNHISLPTYTEDQSVMLNGVEYRYSDRDCSNFSVEEQKENVCLDILHKWQLLPMCGYNLVPEHVETRTLWHPEQPGVEQGKILMWVDIFLIDNCPYIPLPLDITPRKAEEYELRIIFWKAETLECHNRCFVPEINSSSRVYIKAWLGNVRNAQITEVRQPSSNGDTCFNWRMIFQLKYQHADEKIVIPNGAHSSEFDDHLPPVLEINVMHVDGVAVDDVIGSLKLNLTAIPRGTCSSNICKPDIIDISDKIDLLSSGTVHGWWPLTNMENNSKTSMTGVLNMELSLVTKDKAILVPVGEGRNPPHPVPQPKRTESFLVHSAYKKVLECLPPRPSHFTIGFCIFIVISVAYFWGDCGSMYKSDEIAWVP